MRDSRSGCPKQLFAKCLCLPVSSGSTGFKSVLIGNKARSTGFSNFLSSMKLTICFAASNHRGALIESMVTLTRLAGLHVSAPARLPVPLVETRGKH